MYEILLKVKKFRRAKFFVLFLIATLVLAGIYIFSSRQQNSSGLPTNNQNKKSVVFSKRQFDINSKFYLTQNYPPELNIKEDNLLGIGCSQQYVRQKDKWYSDYDKKIEIKDANLLHLIDSAPVALKGSDTDSFIFFTYCSIENGGTVAKYEKQTGGGGSRNVVFFGVMNASGNIEEVTNIKNNGTPYFTCNKPLEFTTSNIFYYGCEGGDGGSGSASIYKIDLDNRISTRIIECDSSVNLNGKPILQCY